LFSKNGTPHATRLKNRQTTAIFFPVLTKQHGEKHSRVELGLHVFVIHVVEARWFFLSRTASSRSHYLCIGLHLFVKDSQRSPDHPFDEHADQYTFGRAG
jgi:hypothetical protein